MSPHAASQGSGFDIASSRWIRLLFGREFPHEQVLILWDTIFAFDPNLELIDLICVAMLLRIRWTCERSHVPSGRNRTNMAPVLEADYSVALQLMLKYPAPQPPHGPHTFVDDAIYLRDHPNAAGGVTLIFKYTGRSPAVPPTAQSTPSRSSTPSFQGFGSLRQRTLGAKSPLSTAARLLQQQGGVEALLQGATKNMIERGERLGINQTVRDAVGEIRRNMQGLQESRSPGRGRGTSFDRAVDHSLVVSMMDRRNRRLASMLEESITDLKLLASAKLEGEKDKNIEAIEVAAAKVQLVKAYLEDPTLALPEEELPALNALTLSSPTDIRSPTVALDTTPVVMTSSAVNEATSALSSPEQDPKVNGLAMLPEEEPPTDDTIDKMDTDTPENNPATFHDPLSTTTGPLSTIQEAQPAPQIIQKERPRGPIPTRSTLAQSSFAWMLEPDTTLSSSAAHGSAFPPNRPSSSSGAPGGTIKKRNNPSRERNAFLFGEVVPGEGTDARKLSEDGIFGMQPIRKGD